MKRIGFNTTFPIELIILSGAVPIDLNNIFVSHKESTEMVEWAESRGLPRNVCAWIKGLYSVAIKGLVDEVAIVENGDCSNARALSEILSDEGIKVYPFSYPGNPSVEFLQREIENFGKSLGLESNILKEGDELLSGMRKKLMEVDENNGRGLIKGQKALDLLLLGTDAGGGNPERVIDLCQEELEKAKSKDGAKDNGQSIGPRLAFVGVPPINPDIHQFCEENMGAIVVFNELARQFAVPGAKAQGLSLAERYTEFTYPCPFRFRFQDIKSAVEERKIDGIIHYVQSFCYRALEDKLLKGWTDIPVLTIEGDKPGNLDSRTKMRIENFVEMLRN